MLSIDATANGAQVQNGTNGAHPDAQQNGYIEYSTGTNGHAANGYPDAPDILQRRFFAVATLATKRDGKPDKAPRTPHTLKLAETNDVDTLGTYAEAMQAVRSGRAAVCGPVLKRDGVICIDLDRAIDAETGALSTGAQFVLAHFPDAMTTISASGYGLHVWIKAKPPFSGACENLKHDGQTVEILAEKFVIERWQPFGEIGEIKPFQNELETLLSAIKPKREPAPVSPITHNGTTANGSGGAYIRAALTGKLNDARAKMQEAQDGEKHGIRFDQARLLGGFLHYGHFNESDIENALGVNFGASESNARKTIRDGVRDGMAAPIEIEAPAPKVTISSTRAVAPLREVTAAEIPAPTLTNEKGNAEYESSQIVALLHPTWKVENLATHAAHAQRIRDILGADLCYNPNLGWLVYDGRCWQRDDKNATKTAARVATLSQNVRDEGATLYRHAATLAQAGRESDAKAMSTAAAALLRHTKQVESKAFIEGALYLAAGLLAVEVERFDQKAWVIGFQNGTWDKGQWREHRREDYLLHLSPVALDFDVDRAEWQRVLERFTNDDADFARMARDVCGYILSAASHLRLLPFFYGPKGTGKSTVAELLQTVLGNMSATIDPKKLQDSAARERLGADLWNRRLAVCSEAGSQRLEAELLKTLSGGDRLAVRFLFREAFTAPPRHVLLMVTNDPPQMDAYDAALKDRVITLPFVHPLDNGAPLELTGGKRIEAVRQDALSPLVQGFAAWAMEGLQSVYETQDIHRAACSQVATAQFWADTDPITPFWETVEESELLQGIGKTELRKRYETWCEAEGARPLNRNRWAKACATHGLEDFTNGKARMWIITQLTQLSTFSKDTYEKKKVPHGQFEKDQSCVSCVNGGVEYSICPPPRFWARWHCKASHSKTAPTV